MKAYEVTFEAVAHVEKGKTETTRKTEVVGANSLRLAASKAEIYAERNGLGEVIKVDLTDKVIL